MLASVKAVSPTEYESWVAEQKKLIATANVEAAKQRKTLSPIPG
jgi:heme/copper-type cytochrome/quinol oxidase subunit 2